MADDESQYRMKEGDYVVLRRGDIFKAVQIQPKKKVNFEKQWFLLDNAVGEFYGTPFEIASGGNLQPQKPKNAESSTDAKEAGADNRNVVDDGKSQKLTRDDIETLKERGLKGQEIVQQLVDNSATFRDKTEFAQNKYVNRKRKKYEKDVTIVKPSCRILAMMYHGRQPGKICHLRYDTLAQMLALGNVRAGSKVLVFETCAGLVLGAVMERMGGYGLVIQMYPDGGPPVRAAMESFGFPAHFHDTLHEFPICRVNALLAGTLDTAAKDDTDNDAGRSIREERDQPVPEQQDSPAGQKMETSSSADPALDPESEEREKRKEIKAQERRVKMEEKRKRLASAAALLEGKDADGLIIASRFHPSSVLLGLLDFLAPSRPFVVYSQYKEPLVECYNKLKDRGGTVGLELTESWLRHYQVLENRTHPVMQMSGGGGFLLSGTTVFRTEEDSQKEGEPAAKRLKLTESEEQ